MTAAARSLVVGGAVCVVLGGLVAAVTGPLGLEEGSWLAAYLVLVCGVGSYAIGTTQSRPAATPLPRTWSLAQVACWTVGNAAVITGALLDVAIVLDAGAALLLVALAVAVVDARHRARSPGWAGPLTTWAYRALLVVLVLSAPVGAVLAHVRGGT